MIQSFYETFQVQLALTCEATTLPRGIRVLNERRRVIARGEFPAGRSLHVEGSRGANGSGQRHRPTPSPHAFGSFRAKRGFPPSNDFKINTVNDKAHEFIMMGIILFRSIECFMYLYQTFCSFVTR